MSEQAIAIGTTVLSLVLASTVVSLAEKIRKGVRDRRWAIIEAVEDARRDGFLMHEELVDLENAQRRRSVHDSGADRLELERLKAKHESLRDIHRLTITKRIHCG